MSRQESQSDSGEKQDTGRADGAVEVPQRPELAPGVELLGEMRETGFENRQWLIRRGDRFIQLTELLYKVAEQSDGVRSLDEVADRVTETTEWLVTADNVHQLIEKRLLPLGVIAPEDIAAGTSGRPDREKRLRSPLAINMRQRLIDPRYIEPVSRILQLLFAPPILLPTLVLVVLAHGWLYLIHGVGRGLREVILAPGLTLAVLAIVFVAGVFHEFGHAAALRYGGGRVRGMGFGLYIIYPALYTDTTDSYRLGRWARVRTDLGGFYFHSLFALGVMALFLATGWEFLLVVVLLISLDIVYQCLPFVRFDGYWTLADLTGIPDFFSQMGAFLRSVLPLRHRGGDRLPDLKPWVKLVFVLYVLVTIPVLFLLLFLLVTNLPGILATFWDSLIIRTGEFSSALNSRDVVGAVLAAGRTFLLALQTLGIACLFYILGRKAWEWSKPTPARQATGLLIVGLILAIGVLFWGPLL